MPVHLRALSYLPLVSPTTASPMHPSGPMNIQLTTATHQGQIYNQLIHWLYCGRVIGEVPPQYRRPIGAFIDIPRPIQPQKGLVHCGVDGYHFSHVESLLEPDIWAPTKIELNPELEATAIMEMMARTREIPDLETLYEDKTQATEPPSP